jgi:DNA-3-methyladenine glycosylase
MLPVMRPLPRSYFELPAVELAPKLLGKIVRKGSCAGVIVETEAYAADAASHARTATPRSAVMRDTYGRWYVYFTYGMHWCANVTCDKRGAGGVLIRAVEPVEGIGLMKRRRKTGGVTDLCSGPAKFAQAFGVSGRDNGQEVGGDFALYDAPEIAAGHLGVSPRIGITKDAHLPWRFYVKGSPFASR